MALLSRRVSLVRLPLSPLSCAPASHANREPAERRSRDRSRTVAVAGVEQRLCVGDERDDARYRGGGLTHESAVEPV